MTEGAERVVAGRYRLARPLGRGGMGVVWQAHDVLLGRDVAVKEIRHAAAHAEPAGPPDPHIQRALREAQAAARLRHPSIITVYDVVFDDDRPWIVMELVDGPSVAQAIDDHGLLPAGQTARIGLRVLDALHAAHRAGITHRDVKPANILLGADQVVLTDFGIAAIDDATALTAAGLMVGSPAYLAPERIDGQAATPAADLWSLGVTLYTAVTGRSPFQRDSTLATFAAILTTAPTPPAHAGTLWPVIKGLLDKDPARRLSAEQARELLGAVAEPARAPGSAPGQRRPGRRPVRVRRPRPAHDDLPQTAAAPPATVAAPTEYQTSHGGGAPGTTEPAAAGTALRAAPVLPAASAALPVLTPGPGSAPMPPPTGRGRWPGLAAVAVLALLISAVAFAASEWHARRPSSPTTAASHPPSSNPSTYVYSQTRLAGRPICAAVWNQAGTRYAVTSADQGLEIFGRDGALERTFAPALTDGCDLHDADVHWDPTGTAVAVIGKSGNLKNRLHRFNVDSGSAVVARLPPGAVRGSPPPVWTGSDVVAQLTEGALVLVSMNGAVGRDVVPRSLFRYKPVPDSSLAIKRPIRALSIPPDGDRFVVSWTTGPDESPLFEVRRLSDGALVYGIGRTSDNGDADLLAVSPNGALVAVGISDFGVEIWDPETRRRVATLRGPDGEISDLRWSGNGRYLLAVSHGRQRAYVFRSGDWTLLGELAPHETTGRGIGVEAGDVGDDGSVFLVPQGARGIDVFTLT
ncbi:WD40 repeat domain-containing serine/threonine-protein kinase [Actinoplanes sp. ATCC 53533]|uniref:WD40 repeat domain-containing serine/threonine-protein kinase n=1 Tax=Actinoplanes sp. ATCC 53533 TaxID=1288362 RepID=UPI00131556D1|nr:WD40 repeat domain-containing serine/threonine-protein kinase [Actinoplanes sp. ATCC 53533]